MVASQDTPAFRFATDGPPPQARAAAPGVAAEADMAGAEASDAEDTLTAMITDAVIRGDIGPALNAAIVYLHQRECDGDKVAGPLALLLGYCRATYDPAPPLQALSRVSVHFDDDFAEAFERIVALLRRQDAQIVTLNAIIADLI